MRLLLGLALMAMGGACGGAIHGDVGRQATDSGDSDSGDSVGDDATVALNPVLADDVWQPLTVMAVENPLRHGAVGDGTNNDLSALTATVDALPSAGGIVYVPAGVTLGKDDVWYVRASHVKVWSENRGGTLFSRIAGQRRKSGIIFEGVEWPGVFGLRLSSDAVERFDAREDNQIVTDDVRDFELVGNEIIGSPAAGVFVYNATQVGWIEGNYIHHTYADHIHHTAASRGTWVWDNWMFNEAPSNGDDGIACVTYGHDSPTCGDMEWFGNVILGQGWGRGYSVIGGDAIVIHDNWAIHTAGASIIVASEPSYDSASSHDITAERNWLVDSAWTIGHPAMLVSGENSAAPAIANVTLSANVVIAPEHGDYGVEGNTTAIANIDMATSSSALPGPQPTRDDVRIRDTSVLATRDISFVAATQRRGLYRIQVRRQGDVFEQRFEYVVQGAGADVNAWLATQASAAIVETRTVFDTTFALVLSGNPLAVPSSLAGVEFAALRSGDRDGSLSWLWKRLNERNYAP